MSFTIAGKDTRIFRVQITKVSTEFDHFMGEGIYFHLNFDNFRTYTSSAGTNEKDPKFDADYRFNYETEFADLMAAKIMKFSFFKGDGEFIGEANCDLLSIAVGCSDCRFSIYESSDRTVGKAFMNIEMEEVAETCIVIKKIRISFKHGKQTLNDMQDARILVETKAAEPGVRRSGEPSNHDAYNVTWEGGLEPNYFGSTVTSILQESGLRVRLVEAGFCGDTDFGSGTISIGALDDGALQNNPTNVPFVNVSFYDANGNEEVAVMTGTLAITHMPKYAQMYAGQNVDGVIHEGQTIPGVKFLPPRMKDTKEAVKI